MEQINNIISWSLQKQFIQKRQQRQSIIKYQKILVITLRLLKIKYNQVFFLFKFQQPLADEYPILKFSQRLSYNNFVYQAVTDYSYKDLMLFQIQKGKQYRLKDLIDIKNIKYQTKQQNFLKPLLQISDQALSAYTSGDRHFTIQFKYKTSILNRNFFVTAFRNIGKIILQKQAENQLDLYDTRRFRLVGIDYRSIFTRNQACPNCSEQTTQVVQVPYNQNFKVNKGEIKQIIVDITSTKDITATLLVSRQTINFFFQDNPDLTVYFIAQISLPTGQKTLKVIQDFTPYQNTQRIKLYDEDSKIKHFIIEKKNGNNIERQKYALNIFGTAQRIFITIQKSQKVQNMDHISIQEFKKHLETKNKQILEDKIMEDEKKPTKRFMLVF